MFYFIIVLFLYFALFKFLISHFKVICEMYIMKIYPTL